MAEERQRLREYISSVNKARSEGRVLDAPSCADLVPDDQKYEVWTWWSPEGYCAVKADKLTYQHIRSFGSEEEAGNFIDNVLRVKYPVYNELPVNIKLSGYGIPVPFAPTGGVRRVFQKGEHQEIAQQMWERYSAQRQREAAAMLAESKRAKVKMFKEAKETKETDKSKEIKEIKESKEVEEVAEEKKEKGKEVVE